MTSDSSTGEIGKEETTGKTETKVFQRYWAAGVELSVDTDEDIKGFVKNRIEAYKQEHQDFKRAETELPRTLRDVLHLRGVFPPKDKNSIAGNPLALLRLDKPPKWPSHDKDYKRVNLRAEMPTGSDIIGKKEKSTKKDHSNSALDNTNKKPYTVNSSNQKKSSKHNQNEKNLANYNPHGYSRQLSTLTKLYDEQTKYSEKEDTFDYKFDIFLKQCANTDIPVNALGIEFPSMLKEDTRNFYYSSYSNEDELSLEELYQEAFRNVCERPSNTLNGLLSDLRSVAEHHDWKTPFANTDVVLFTDRKYHQRRNIGRSQFELNHGQYKSKSFGEEGYGNKKNVFERDEAFERIKRNMTEKIHKIFSQYVLEIEGRPTESNITEDVEFPEKELDIEMESYILDTTFLSMKPTYKTSNFFTCTSDKIDGLSTKMALANRATEYALVGSFLYPPHHDLSTRYGPHNFKDIYIDAGAANNSTGGYNQWIALQKYQKVEIDSSKKGTVNVQFGIGSTSSIGSVKVNIPIGTIEFHIVRANTPFLLCLKDMDKLEAYYDNITDRIYLGDQSYPANRRFGHAIFSWGEILTNHIANSIFLIDTELRQLHRRFCHPSVRRLFDPLCRSNHEVDRKNIEQINKFCKTCQKFGASPRRFKFTLRDPDLQFNHIIVADIMYIDEGGSKPALHIIDIATRFQASR
ncbi:hypothetical protein GcM3_082001 [Golovinomyces cichoracearum]|uniref:Uncharacterized protein n=1 Tax=Golovinomyces cichoracearum TaxID=62708 RepID=A0A420IN02_9PEZI|nr:hypothetical protein GcM3_082001 [Golovinomyces cichoracearum]